MDLGYIVRDAVIPYITKDAKHVLDHLASREGENGKAWPSTQTISQCTNISIKGVQRAINCLLANNLIIRESGKLTGKSNHYKVTLPESYFREAEAREMERRHQRRMMRHLDLPSIVRPDRPPVSHPDGTGGPSRADGVGHADPRIKTILCEGTQRETQNKSQSVGPSVSQCPARIADCHMPAGGMGHETMGNLRGATENPPEPIRQLPSGKFSVDEKYAARTCWEIGASLAEAYKFWRYNQVRGWPLLDHMTLKDIARRWRDKWMHEHPDEYRTEQLLRKAKTPKPNP